VQPGYPEFRRKLDAVLRQRDPAALRQFLIDEGQWDAETTTDPERAMWMMIATSPALGELHDEAVRWLADHGYEEEARALGGPRAGGKGGAAGRPPSSAHAQGHRGPRPRHQGRRPGPRPPHREH
jgi:hypothetical protein